MAVVFGMSRHGETDQNLAVRALLARDYEMYWHIRGRYDRPENCLLTADGEAQARALNLSLRRFMSQWEGRRIVIYASPYVRAKRTAEIACDGWYDGKIIEDARLRERSWGLLEYEQFTHETVNDYSRRAEQLIRYPSFRPQGGESVYDRFPDVESFVADVQRLHPDDVVWAIAHGEIFRMKRMVQLGLSAAEWERNQHPVPNCRSEAWLRLCLDTGQLHDVPRWHSVIHCPKDNPEGNILWTPHPRV